MLTPLAGSTRQHQRSPLVAFIDGTPWPDARCRAATAGMAMSTQRRRRCDQERHHGMACQREPLVVDVAPQLPPARGLAGDTDPVHVLVLAWHYGVPLLVVAGSLGAVVSAIRAEPPEFPLSRKEWPLIALVVMSAGEAAL